MQARTKLFGVRLVSRIQLRAHRGRRGSNAGHVIMQYFWKVFLVESTPVHPTPRLELLTTSDSHLRPLTLTKRISSPLLLTTVREGSC